MSSLESVIITEQILTRLDKFLVSQYPAYSRSYFQYLIEQGLVLRNGQKLKKKEIPQVGDEIDICFQLPPEIDLEPEEIALDILFEDEHLLIINKPTGMVVHPAPGHPRHTFVNALLYHCKTLPQTDNLRPGIVHRLDKDTSGVLIAAKTTEAHQKLVSLFCERKIQKKYIAVCIGNPGNITLSLPIKRHKSRRQEMSVDPEGKEAISIFRTLQENNGLFLVEVDLITGRTHQIRVHLKHHKTPILGDPIYGSPSMNQKWGVSEQLLHAYEISFIHPFTYKTIFIRASLPEKILKLFPPSLSELPRP